MCVYVCVRARPLPAAAPHPPTAICHLPSAVTAADSPPNAVTAATAIAASAPCVCRRLRMTRGIVSKGRGSAGSALGYEVSPPSPSGCVWVEVTLGLIATPCPSRGHRRPRWGATHRARCPETGVPLPL